jgi:hypothetical protein
MTMVPGLCLPSNMTVVRETSLLELNRPKNPPAGARLLMLDGEYCIESMS